MTPPRRAQTAQEFVLGRLRDLILTRELLPGEPLRQDALAEHLGVSRVPLREALKILEGEGQITYRPHRGYVVTELSIEDLREVYELRRILEDEVTRLAMPNLSRDQVAAMSAIRRDIEEASGAADVVEMAQTNRRFHFVLFEAAGRPRLLRMIRLQWDATDTYRSIYYGQETNRVTVNREHRKIVTAIRSGDTELVVRLLHEHREHAVAALSDIIEPTLQ